MESQKHGGTDALKHKKHRSMAKHGSTVKHRNTVKHGGSMVKHRCTEAQKHGGTEAQ